MDARALPYGDGAAETVLTLGPMYRWPSVCDRVFALTEAIRCAALGAPVVASAISRWAKPAVKASMSELGDPAVRGYLLRVLARGQDVEGNAFDLVSYNHDPQGAARRDGRSRVGRRDV